MSGVAALAAKKALKTYHVGGGGGGAFHIECMPCQDGVVKSGLAGA